MDARWTCESIKPGIRHFPSACRHSRVRGLWHTSAANARPELLRSDTRPFHHSPHLPQLLAPDPQVLSRNREDRHLASVVCADSRQAVRRDVAVPSLLESAGTPSTNRSVTTTPLARSIMPDS